MEEKTVPLLNLSDIDGGRASLRRRLSLLDLNLRQVASVLLTPTEFADWSATSLDAMLSPRSARSSRDLASPSGRERKFDALLSHQRTGSTVDRLSVPCRPPLFLGPDFLNSGLDSLASGSRRSTTSMVLRRLSTFSPRRDKARDSKAWASGGMASVHKLTYQVDAELQTVVWKAEDAAASTLATDLMGITATQSRGGVPPHFSGRSVASYRISALLGLDLIPETRWSVHQGEVGTAMDLALGHAPSSKGPFYLTLDTETAQALKAIDQGLEALAKRFGFCSVTWAEATAHTLVFDHFLVEFVFDRHGDYVLHPDGTRRESRRRLCAWVRQDFGNPTLRRDLTRLQWLDHLTGQVDRNPMNYLVHWREDGSAVLSAIDNDLSFPAEAVLPEPTMINQVWLPAMPEVVDEVLAEAILGAKEEDWRGCLQGLLLPVEVQMACARLAAVKDRLKGLQAQQRVVGTGERAWSSQQMSEWLGLLELRDMFRGGEEDQPKEWALEGIWRRASQRSYLLRDATKQVMLLMGRENGPLFDPAGIRAFIRDDLLKG